MGVDGNVKCFYISVYTVKLACGGIIMKLVRRMDLEEFRFYLKGEYFTSRWERARPVPGKDFDETHKVYFFPLETLIKNTHHEDIREAICATYLTYWGTRIYHTTYPIGIEKGIYTLPCIGDIKRTITTPCVIIVFEADDNIPHIKTADRYSGILFDEILLDGYDNTTLKIDRIFMPTYRSLLEILEDTRYEDIIDVTDINTYNNELDKYKEINNDEEYSRNNISAYLYNDAYMNYTSDMRYNEKERINHKVCKMMRDYTLKDVENTLNSFKR